MSVELCPLSLGELLDRTFTSYREHFWTFVGIMIPAEAVIVAAGLVLQALGIQAVLNQFCKAINDRGRRAQRRG